MFKFISKTASSLDFSKVTEEDFYKMKHTFNIPRIGKLYPSLTKLKKIRRKRDGKNTK